MESVSIVIRRLNNEIDMERIKQIDLEIELLEKKLNNIKDIERTILDLRIKKALLPVCFVNNKKYLLNLIKCPH